MLPYLARQQHRTDEHWPRIWFTFPIWVFIWKFGHIHTVNRIYVHIALNEYGRFSLSRFNSNCICLWYGNFEFRTKKVRATMNPFKNRIWTNVIVNQYWSIHKTQIFTLIAIEIACDTRKKNEIRFESGTSHRWANWFEFCDQSTYSPSS